MVTLPDAFVRLNSKTEDALRFGVHLAIGKVERFLDTSKGTIHESRPYLGRTLRSCGSRNRR